MGRQALAPVLRRVVWTLSRQGARLGWAGGAGALLIVFAVVFQLTASSKIHNEIKELKDDAALLQSRHQMALTQPVAVKPGVTQQLTTFYEFFPPQSAVPDRLAKVYAAARKRGIILERGEYKVVQEQGWRLLRYQITLPVKGSYEQIRGFAADVLAAVPASAIDEISLKRDGIGATVIEAQIKLTLFLGASTS
jgi:Tfp pilus assembly protein PilO